MSPLSSIVIKSASQDRCPVDNRHDVDGVVIKGKDCGNALDSVSLSGGIFATRTRHFDGIRATFCCTDLVWRACNYNERKIATLIVIHDYADGINSNIRS